MVILYRADKDQLPYLRAQECMERRAGQMHPISRHEVMVGIVQLLSVERNRETCRTPSMHVWRQT
jgi:hypothetical protein